METMLRKARLVDLAEMLRDQDTRKVDVIAGPLQVGATRGRMVVKGIEPVLTDDGVSMAEGEYVPTQVFVEGLAQKLNVPAGYLKRLHHERPDMFDATVNGWLLGSRKRKRADGAVEQEFGPDERSFMLRTFTTPDGPGIARAFLSDKYAVIDHLDVLTAVMSGVRDSGAEVEVTECDLTDRRMRVKFSSEAISALAPELLRGYRSPFTGASADDNPVVFAGFRVSNSETGGGAFQIVPELTVEVCSNGMTITKDAIRAVHLGGKQDAGVIRWSEETERKSLELVQARTRDAVATFLDVDYMTRVIRKLEEVASKPVVDAAATVERVARKLMYSQEETAGVLDHFIRGGQMTAGGVLHATTAYSQLIEDADRAAVVQESGIRAMELV